MSSNIEAILTAISRDKSDGATSLALRGLDALELLAADLPAEPESAVAQIISLVRRIDGLRPSMTAIGNQAVIVASRARAAILQGTAPCPALRHAVTIEREALGQANNTIASLAGRTLGGGGGIAVTCSWSVTAMRSLVAAAPASVRIGEGHRLGDGLKGANWLAARGLDVEVLPDGALPEAVSGARFVLVGADQILFDGSVVNRCSTFSLALAARFFSVPFYVACQRIKLGANLLADIEESPAGLFGQLPPGVTGRAPLFDVTPAACVTAVITESGVLSPGEAGEIGRGIGTLRADILGE